MSPEELRRLRTGQQPQGQQPMITDGSMSQSDAAAMAMMDPTGMMGYNPLLGAGGQPDIKRVDRWLRYTPPKGDDVNKFWMTETELAEELVKANLTVKEFNWFIREYAEIEAIAGGDGNAKWVQSRQRKFMLKLQMTRARSDNHEVGMRDVGWLMGQNINQRGVSEVKMPSEDTNTKAVGGGGFLGIFRRGGGGQ